MITTPSHSQQAWHSAAEYNLAAKGEITGYIKGMHMVYKVLNMQPDMNQHWRRSHVTNGKLVVKHTVTCVMTVAQVTEI